MKRVFIGLGASLVLAVCIAGIVLVVRALQEQAATRRFIAAGPANLVRGESAARREGIPLTAAQLQKPLPPPSQNAAPLYVKLTALLHDKPLHLPKFAEGMDAFHAYTPEQIAAIRKTLAARQDVMTLVHQAADKPQCVFTRDWSQGAALNFPEYQHQREVARLLKTQSYFLARDGYFREAIANQALGFRVADHAAADHTLIGYLVGIADEAITLSGMQSFLEQAGPNAAVDSDVAKTVTATYVPLSLRSALVGDIGLNYVSFQKAHQYEKYGAEAAIQAGFPDGDAPQSHNPPASQVSVAEQERLHDFIDAWQAEYLSEMIPLVRASDAPRMTRRSIFVAAHRQATEGAKLPMTSPYWIPRLLMPAFDGLDLNGTRIEAGEMVTLAAAALLAEKAKTGMYPATLPQGFMDPYADKPLLYRREGGGFVVYSAGPTGHFDGGRLGEKVSGQESLFRYPAVLLPN